MLDRIFDYIAGIFVSAPTERQMQEERRANELARNRELVVKALENGVEIQEKQIITEQNTELSAAEMQDMNDQLNNQINAAKDAKTTETVNATMDIETETTETVAVEQAKKHNRSNLLRNVMITGAVVSTAAAIAATALYFTGALAATSVAAIAAVALPVVAISAAVIGVVALGVAVASHVNNNIKEVAAEIAL